MRVDQLVDRVVHLRQIRLSVFYKSADSGGMTRGNTVAALKRLMKQV
jgi:hypothetical protein